MDNNLKIQLKEAKKLYDSKKYDESLILYEELFSENPDEFKRNDLISYSGQSISPALKNSQMRMNFLMQSNSSQN